MFNCPAYYNYNQSAYNYGSVSLNNTLLKNFFARHLMQRAISVFKWEMPDNWAGDYFLYSLYGMGYIAIINTDLYGAIPQACGLVGQDVFYRPTNVVIANPVLRCSENPRIGVDCVLIKLQPDYGSISDLVTFYAEMMALCAQTAGVNILNSRLSYVFAAGNKSAAESFKALYDKIVNGEPAAFVDKQLFNADGSPAWQAFEQNVGQNYIAGKLLDDLRKWELRFDTAIGIANSNTEKRERLIVDEVNSNNEETKSVASLWLENLQKGCKQANKMFNLNLSVDWRDAGKEDCRNGSDVDRVTDD